MSKVIAIKKYDVDQPAQLEKMSVVLKGHIVKNKLYTNISGKNYAHVEGWQFAGGLLGLYPRVVNVENLSSGSEYRWKAEVEVVDRATDKIVSTGFAICSNKENKKKAFDEYAILSMAQTRAIGKAYRNLLGWVMKLAGYEGTPSEEMTKVGDRPAEPKEITIVPEGKATLKKDQVVGPDGEPTYICSKCEDPIADEVAEYSFKRFGKRLCRDHQVGAKSK